jgi:chlorite dismutase
MVNPLVLSPETLEGWWALHQVFTVDHAPADEWRRQGGQIVANPVSHLAHSFAELSLSADAGWSAAVQLIGSSADIMLVHFRQTLDDIGVVQRWLAESPAMASLKPKYSFLSVTEAGMYGLTAKLARETAARGGVVGDAEYAAELTRRLTAERSNPHVQKRLFPPVPDDMPYVCFYPMSKRRDTGQNWYSLQLDERSQLMRTHGETGRRYAGRIFQIITGSIGFEQWEWGVTLFGKDPLDFKKLITDMRFDEASAKYAEFGEFYVGRLVRPSD